MNGGSRLCRFPRMEENRPVPDRFHDAGRGGDVLEDVRNGFHSIIIIMDDSGSTDGVRRCHGRSFC